MKRRDFISNGTVAAAGIATLLGSACQSGSPGQNTDNDSKAAFELEEIDIATLQKKFEDGSYTSESATRLYLQRIAGIDQSGHLLRSVIELNPDAISIAKAMDEERRSGKVRGPLHGVPVLIKDNIDTADKMQTTAGSLALEGNIADSDAFVVKKLRDAGAVLLGKTNLSEWANFRSNKSCSGWSSRGSQTKNPYILDHNPCGSSSGSGVAVAANLCTVAVGTETDGSITCPASTNGIVGIKPTVGLVSRTGIIPISKTQDTAGPMGRTVTDVAVLLSILAGEDEADAITRESVGKVHADYTRFLDPNALQGKRIGIEKNPQGKNQFMHALLQQALEELKQRGATIVEIEYLDKIDKLGNDEFELMKFEFKDGLNRYLSKTKGNIRSLADLIEFNRKNEDRLMPYFKQETLESSEEQGGLDTAAYREAFTKSHLASKKILDTAFSENKLDAITGLTMGPACSIDNIYGDRWGEVFLTQPAATSGYPHISVPCGMVYDLPVGISFFGPAYSEPVLLGIAYAHEQASKKRVPPGFRKSFLA